MTYKLDIKDLKILYEIDTNSRQTYRKIGKKVGLSKDSVVYRINAMQQADIIKHFHTVIDVGKLGYISFRLYIKLHSATPEKENEILEFLRRQKTVTWLVSIDGEYDIGAWVLTKNIQEMNNLWKSLMKKYINYIEKKSLTIFTKVSYFPRSYLLNMKRNFEEFVFITEPDEVELGKYDLELLKVLSDNPRMKILDICKKLKVTPKTVISRIKIMEKRKIIIGYRCVFDLEKLGYQHFKVHFNLHNLTEQKEAKLRQYIKEHPNIIFDNEVMGGDDVEIEIQVKTIEDLRKIIDEMKKEFSDIIKDHKYLWFYKEHKFAFLPENV